MRARERGREREAERERERERERDMIALKAYERSSNSCKSVTWSAVPSASVVSLKLNHSKLSSDWAMAP